MPDAPSSLVVRAMQWDVLPELHDAPDLDASDLACLAELRDVLARRGKLRRFAVHLAHRHFELGPDEVLIERPDPDGRTQHVTVGRLDDEPAARPTTWLFDEGPELRLSDAVYCVCMSDPAAQAGCIRHGKSSSPTRAGQIERQIEQKRISEEEARHQAGMPVAGHDPRKRGRYRSIRGDD